MEKATIIGIDLAKRLVDERQLAWADEAEWRVASPAGALGALDYGPQVIH